MPNEIAESSNKTDTFFQSHKSCEQVSRLFSLFSNPSRFKILCILKDQDYCLSDIVRQLEGKHSNISQQLKILTLAGYLTKRRQGKQMFYHLENSKIKELLHFLWKKFKEG